MGRLTRAAAAALVVIGVVAGAIWLQARGVFHVATASGAVAVGLDDPLAAGPIHIAVLGTSLSHDEAWPDILARDLSACRAALVTVRVTARPGATSIWGLRRAAAALSPPPDLLLVEFAVNDASLFRGVTLTRARDNHRRILAAAQAAGARTALMTTNPAAGREALERPGLGAYFDLYREMAAAGDVALVDLEPVWRAMPAAERASLIPDGVHPTRAEGGAVIARALGGALAAAVCAPAPISAAE